MQFLVNISFLKFIWLLKNKIIFFNHFDITNSRDNSIIQRLRIVFKNTPAYNKVSEEYKSQRTSKIFSEV